MEIQNQSKHIYISYDDKDIEDAEKIYKYLKDVGLSVWSRNKDICGGQNIEEAINKAIKDSSIFLALLSKNSVSKSFSQKERKKALGYQLEFPLSEIYIIPVRLDNCELNDGELQNMGVINMLPSFETGLKKIRTVIEKEKKIGSSTDKGELDDINEEGSTLYKNSIKLNGIPKRKFLKLSLINRLLLIINVFFILYFLFIRYTEMAGTTITAISFISSFLIFLFPIKNIYKNAFLSSYNTSILFFISTILLITLAIRVTINLPKDLRISRITTNHSKPSSWDTIIIEGRGISQLEKGDRLAVYGPQTRSWKGEWLETPITILGVVQVDEKSAIAQLQLIHESYKRDNTKLIEPGLRVAIINDLDLSFLLPAFGDGYLLRNDVIRLKPDITVQLGDTFTVLEPLIENSRIIDHLTGETKFIVISRGEDNQVVKVKLTSDDMIPKKGVLVKLYEIDFSTINFEPEMVLINSVVFQMGSKQGDNDEIPVETITTDTFYISKNEITNHQFRYFIEDGGYYRSELWTPDGYDWLVKRNISRPQYWRDPLFYQPQQPVVGVSWYESVAYTNWLTGKTGQEYRLPTEAEWELSCTGTGRIYPWGNTWNGEKANFADISFSKVIDHEIADTQFDDGFIYPAPVGRYLSGATPDNRIFDLAGNVWEWTSSQYRLYPYNPMDGRENITDDGKRVIRGGGWGSKGIQLRCANRGEEKPYFRTNIIGFRVVRN